MTSGFRLGGNPQECPFQCPVFFGLLTLLCILDEAWRRAVQAVQDSHALWNNDVDLQQFETQILN